MDETCFEEVLKYFTHREQTLYYEIDNFFIMTKKIMLKIILFDM